MDQRSESEPVYVSHRFLNDTWADGIQQIEIMGGGRCRLVLYRDRTTTDGVHYREPVDSLLFDISKLPGAVRRLLRAVFHRKPEPTRVLN